MGRQTAWVLALLITCVPGGPLPHDSSNRPARQRRSRRLPPGTAKTTKTTRTSRRTVRSRKTVSGGSGGCDRVELGINDQQSAAINQIFESTIPKLRETRQELDAAEDELSACDQGAQGGHRGCQRAAGSGGKRGLNTTRPGSMLYRMHLLLSPDQRTKLEAIRARNDQGRRDRDPPPGYRRYP